MPSQATYGVLFDIEAIGPFTEAIARRQDVRHVFVVTDKLTEYQQVVSRIDRGIATNQLYSDYLRTFEINVRR